jgi:hypothetical protein
MFDISADSDHPLKYLILSLIALVKSCIMSLLSTNLKQFEFWVLADLSCSVGRVGQFDSITIHLLATLAYFIARIFWCNPHVASEQKVRTDRQTDGRTDGQINSQGCGLIHFWSLVPSSFKVSLRSSSRLIEPS